MRIKYYKYLVTYLCDDYEKKLLTSLFESHQQNFRYHRCTSSTVITVPISYQPILRQSNTEYSRKEEKIHRNHIPTEQVACLY